MALDLSKILVVGVSSRSLFNLEKENQIFNNEGILGFRKYQLEHEEDPLDPRNSFSFSAKFITLKHKCQKANCRSSSDVEKQS